MLYFFIRAQAAALECRHLTSDRRRLTAFPEAECLFPERGFPPGNPGQLAFRVFGGYGFRRPPCLGRSPSWFTIESSAVWCDIAGRHLSRAVGSPLLGQRPVG